MQNLEHKLRAKAHNILDRIVEEPKFAQRFGENLFEKLEQYSCSGKYLSTLAKLENKIEDPVLDFYIHQKYEDKINTNTTCKACLIKYL